MVDTVWLANIFWGWFGPAKLAPGTTTELTIKIAEKHENLTTSFNKLYRYSIDIISRKIKRNMPDGFY